MIIRIEDTQPGLVERKVYAYRRKRKARILRRRLLGNLFFDYPEKLKMVSSPFLKEFERQGYIDRKYKEKIVSVPRLFSLKKNFDECLLFFKQLLSSFYYKNGDLKIDFSNCCETSNACFVLFDLMIKEMMIVQERYNKNLFHKTFKQVIIIHPSNEDDKTNKYLIAFGYITIKDVDNVNKEESFLPLGLIRGKNKSYHESLKGLVSKRVVQFVDKTLDRVDFKDYTKDKNAIDGLITEILTNAEEHSISNSEWYVNGISFHEDQHDVNIVELNLSIMNFGKSMYESFEETKILNKDNYALVDSMYQTHKSLFTPWKKFERESLFILYMLNDGISRLKYEGDGRGNGTMHFISSFLYLGRYGEENIEFNPLMNVISGHTVLTCDGRYKPSDENAKISILSLNKEKTLSCLPDSDYLCAHNEFFPGTILECKIYLNKDYFKKTKQISN